MGTKHLEIAGRVLREPSERIRSAARMLLKDVASTDCVYVSTPITTGRSYFVLTAEGVRPSARAQSQLRSENVAHASAVIHRAREHFAPRHIIEPITFPEPADFVQEDFHAFWSFIIEAAVTTMVQCDGWAYSTGCLWELNAALEKGCEVVDERFAVMDSGGLSRSISEASSVIRSPQWQQASDSAIRMLNE